VTFNVVEPASETATKTSEDNFQAGTQGVGMVLHVTVQPTDVSFAYVEMQEVSGPATNITGYFQQFDPANFYHTANGWAALDPVNAVNDHASGSGCPSPWYAGGFDWDIPRQWRVIGKTKIGTLPNRLQHYGITASDGTSTVSKLGCSATRTP
jgi:hypothetical protein